MRGSMHEEYHITDIDHAMSKYWQVRLIYIYNIIINYPTPSDPSLRSIFRILVGESLSTLVVGNDYIRFVSDTIKFKMTSDWM